MKQKKTALLFFVAVLSIAAVALVYSNLRPEIKPPLPTYPPSEDFEFLAIHELNMLKPSSGYYNTEGYVAKIFNCPPCPAGAACIPCMEENIVISEQDKTVETYILTNMDLIIFLQNPGDLFKLGDKLQFSIRVRDSRTTTGSMNDVELVGFNP